MDINIRINAVTPSKQGITGLLQLPYGLKLKK
jgi:hypothetical protein